MVPTRDGFGEAILEIGRKNKDIVALCADLEESTRLDSFKKRLPERFIECGVAEQNMVAMAAGLAVSGKIPFVSTYGVFCPGRTLDQIRTAVCYNNANVKMASSHCGITVGPDGATHQALEDIAITRTLPNMTVIAPCDYAETKKAVTAAAKHKGPVYLRFERQASPVITTNKTPFKIEAAEIFRPGDDITIIACGPLVYEALLAAKELAKEDISVEVINCHTIKPLDHKTIIASVKKTKAAITIENHQAAGGLGGAVAELLSEKYPAPLLRIGMPDSFGESGQPGELLKKYGLTADNIMAKAKKLLKKQ